MKPARRMGNFDAWVDPAGVQIMQDKVRQEKESVLLSRSFAKTEVSASFRARPASAFWYDKNQRSRPSTATASEFGFYGGMLGNMRRKDSSPPSKESCPSCSEWLMGARQKTAAKSPASPPRHAVYLEDGRSMRRQVNLTTSAMTSAAIGQPTNNVEQVRVKRNATNDSSAVSQLLKSQH
ncbi:hypothetical protein GUITHDRAFT_116334 [Guillardia theta CCMP2712]|uniref:Uncharacterized protein n=1 Tax=Guillardia theta (strain CCMP2712) TaxID=905079 RepID=L1INY2_GUITC|nr:hypothetical protein GUITHDRAFT_116334 [Guillardia theta CCMP2712]EKX37525.1 hypothetical protein GUITHDRAFT_116334 [Guillardia theta CCMP2712]|eukprot:XP_005824505.1 hypothetical protein GUITHDRAFT_116334 [Guillardia theta CCMP2712]